MIDKTNPPNTPDFELVSRIGVGGMGSVYEAVDPRTTETVAVKFLDTQPGANDEREQRFRREIEILKHLNHPHIVRVLNTGTSEEDVPYFVMEFVGGGTLRERMKFQAVHAEEVLRVVRQISSALDYLHGNGVIHRDLKPENVLVLDDGTIKLTDFGISSITADAPSQLTTTGQVLGTFEYMSPEQRHRLPVDHRADIYSLGILTYELLTGRRPAGRFRSASEWNPRLPQEVDAVLNCALSEEREDRYASCREFAAHLIKAFRFKSIVRRACIICLGAAVLLLCAILPIISDWATSVAKPPVANGPPNKKVHENQTPAYFLKLADKAGQKGDWGSVIECCTQAINLDSQNSDALLYRAHAYHALGSKPEALADLNKVYELDSTNVDVNALMGKILNELGDNKGATDHLLKALEHYPKDVGLRVSLAECLYKEKQYIPALKQLNTAIKANDPLLPGEAYYYRALVRAKAGDWTNAREDLRTWVAKHPDNHLAISSLGKFMLDATEASGVRDFKTGLDLCQRAYEMCKTEGIVLRNYAHALLKHGELLRAKEIAEQALEHSSSQKKVVSRKLLQKIENAIAVANN
jgi:serine/threonine protein kinase